MQAMMSLSDSVYFFRVFETLPPFPNNQPSEDTVTYGVRSDIEKHVYLEWGRGADLCIVIYLKFARDLITSCLGSSINTEINPTPYLSKTACAKKHATMNACNAGRVITSVPPIEYVLSVIVFKMASRCLRYGELPTSVAAELLMRNWPHQSNSLSDMRRATSRSCFSFTSVTLNGIGCLWTWILRQTRQISILVWYLQYGSDSTNPSHAAERSLPPCAAELTGHSRNEKICFASAIVPKAQISCPLVWQ